MSSLGTLNQNGKILYKPFKAMTFLLQFTGVSHRHVEAHELAGRPEDDGGDEKGCRIRSSSS